MGRVEVRKRIQNGCIRDEWLSCADELIWPKCVGEHVGFKHDGEMEVGEHVGLVSIDEIVAVSLVGLDVVYTTEKVGIDKYGIDVLEEVSARANVGEVVVDTNTELELHAKNEVNGGKMLDVRCEDCRGS